MKKSDKQPPPDIKAHEILNWKEEGKCVFIPNAVKHAVATGWLSLREISHPCREKPQCLLTTPSGQQCLLLHSFISAATTQTSSSHPRKSHFIFWNFIFFKKVNPTISPPKKPEPFIWTLAVALNYLDVKHKNSSYLLELSFQALVTTKKCKNSVSKMKVKKNKRNLRKGWGTWDKHLVRCRSLSLPVRTGKILLMWSLQH